MKTLEISALNLQKLEKKNQSGQTTKVVRGHEP